MKHRFSFLVGISIVIVVLIFLPTGFECALQFKDAEKCKVLVEEVDNSSLIDTGLIRTGQQICKVRFLTGRFEGHIFYIDLIFQLTMHTLKLHKFFYHFRLYSYPHGLLSIKDYCSLFLKMPIEDHLLPFYKSLNLKYHSLPV